METPTTALVETTKSALPKFAISDAVKAERETALTSSALIAKVSDHDSKVKAVRAQLELKRLLTGIEKARKELKEPLLQAGRELDTLCARESLELEKEFGRVSQVVKEFDDAERRRVAEEERLQKEELARIEREKQAEIERLRKEQEEREAAARREQEERERVLREEREAIERKAREEREAIERQAAEATNKKQREAAEKQRQESERRADEARREQEQKEAKAREEQERQQAELQRQAQETQAKAEQIEEKAGDAAYVAAKPVEITTVKGQRQTSDWKITVSQPFVLAKYHPDLVDIKPRLADIKRALNDGREIKGIEAERVHGSNVRLPAERKAIDV